MSREPDGGSTDSAQARRDGLDGEATGVGMRMVWHGNVRLQGMGARMASARHHALGGGGEDRSRWGIALLADQGRT